MLEPAVLGEGEMLDDASDAQVCRCERLRVDPVGREIDGLSDDRTTLLVEALCQADALSRWVEIGVELTGGHGAILAGCVRCHRRAVAGRPSRGRSDVAATAERSASDGGRSTPADGRYFHPPAEGRRTTATGAVGRWWGGLGFPAGNGRAGILKELWSSYEHNPPHNRRQAVSAANDQLVGARKCRSGELCTHVA